MKFKGLFFFIFFCISIFAFSQNHSVARKWNEVILQSIRNDLARPTVHARNLFHISAAMYDAWSVFDDDSETYFLGNEIHGEYIPYKNTVYSGNKKKNQEMAISYAAYRLLIHRYEISPGYKKSKIIIDSLFKKMGYDRNFKSIDYTSGNSAALGNYIAQKVIDYSWNDGSNEKYFYANLFYEPVNKPMILKNPGIKKIVDPNRWQPLAFEKFIDQSGNELAGSVPEFLGPEWGQVLPFSLEKQNLKTMKRDGYEYPIYFDPGSPPQLLDSENKLNNEYSWNHSFVSIWGSHHDPNDGILWDISPNNIGNLNTDYKDLTISSLKTKFKPIKGGDISTGYKINPYTKKPYTRQIVPRGDYTRVIAEFWADGPDSETPPGHWFTILNYVSYHQLFERRFEGTNEIIDPLEWDVKAYFLLGGAMHDSAIAAWGLKGYYDYIRPISAIRFMSSKGQSSDPKLPGYDPLGIKLVDNLIELVKKGDLLSGKNGENIGKIKVYSWRGHNFINDPKKDYAGVGWILAENWFPYQRPTFVTPNFSGYVSGHSTYSRAAAEILTLLTGNAFFPGGMGEFTAKKNKFLVFEKGPTQDVKIQWATYRDASNQCSLSRIWGGIHPPVDDLPGRVIGEKIGIKAYNYGKKFFSK